MTYSSLARAALPLLVATLALTLPARAQDKGAAPANVATPAPVVATQTGPGEITVTWTVVPGAIGYNVGRSVFPNGFQRLCPQCPPTATYVDKGVTAGVRHSYRVVALFPGGKASRPAASEPVTPEENGSGSGAAETEPGANEPAVPAGDSAANVQVTRPVTRETPLDPIVEVEAPPGWETVATLHADSASSCGGSAASGGDTTRLPVRRPVLGAVRADREPDDEAPPTERPPASAAYEEGRCRNPGVLGYPSLWDSVASRSDLSHEDQVAAWKEIVTVALAYRHLLQRLPTAEETRRHVLALQGGRGWRQLWLELAQSPERDERFGYWAPAPMAGAPHAQRVFGLPFTPRTEQCFGGLGPGCAGTVPFWGVEPRWFGIFQIPDGPQMGYVSVGVAVGSILHDNACLGNPGGLNCSGLGAGDLIKTGLWPASLEWNKAAWNLIDKRTWREVFGPYPTNTEVRLDAWYDDLRLVRNRPAMMAEAVSMIAFPGLTVVYRGGETRQSRALKAPPGTSLDETDAAFCASGRAGERHLAPLKASWVFCQ